MAEKITIFGMEIIEIPELRGDEVYFLTPASEEEVRKGNYFNLYGVKISIDLKKHGLIKNVRP